MNLDALMNESKIADYLPNTLSTSKFVLIEFYAAWSGACHIMTPVIKETAEKYGDLIKIVRYDVDKQTNKAPGKTTRKTPSYSFYANGVLVEQIEGIVSKKVLQNKVKILLRNLN